MSKNSNSELPWPLDEVVKEEELRGKIRSATTPADKAKTRFDFLQYMISVQSRMMMESIDAKANTWIIRLDGKPVPQSKDWVKDYLDTGRPNLETIIAKMWAYAPA